MLVISVLCLVLSVGWVRILYIGTWRWLYNKSKHVAHIVRKYNKYWCLRRSIIDFITGEKLRFTDFPTDICQMMTMTLRFKGVSLVEFSVLLPRYEDTMQCDRSVKFVNILYNTSYSDCRTREEQFLVRILKKRSAFNVRNESTVQGCW